MDDGTVSVGLNDRPLTAYSPALEGGGIIFPPGDPLRPVGGATDGEGGPRQYDFPVGTNTVPTPRHTEDSSFADLRNLAGLYDGIQLCERAIFRVLRRLRLRLVARGGVGRSDETNARMMEEWLATPDKRGHDLSSWLVAAMRDNLELDAVAIYHRRNRAGGLYGLELVAGETIAPLIDSGGRRPMAPAPAYAQVLYGVVASLWSADDIDYLVEHPRTDSLYGTSTVESILLRVNQALRKEHYDLTRYTDGTVPSGILHTREPKLLALSADQLTVIERMWNATLAGNDAMRMRSRLVPPGWEFESLPTEAVTVEFDRWLLNITVAAFGLTMDELGFTETSNRSVGAAQERVIYRNAVRPRADFFANYLTTRVIGRYAGQPLEVTCSAVSIPGRATRSAGYWDDRYSVQWDGNEEPQDINAQAQAATQLVGAGILTPQQARHWLKFAEEM